MISEKNINTTLLTLLLIALTAYHLLGVVEAYFFGDLEDKSLYQEVQNLSTIVKTITSFGIMILTIKLQFIVKLVLGGNYIAGEYQGTSKKEIGDGEQKGNEKVYNQKFTISQNLISTKISGFSRLGEERLVSTWWGKAVDYNNGNFKFLLNLESHSGMEIGILSLRFDENKSQGYYYSAESGKINYKFSFTVIKKEKG